MDKAVTALALEVPGEVWDDVADRWQAVRDEMTALLGWIAKQRAGMARSSWNEAVGGAQNMLNAVEAKVRDVFIEHIDGDREAAP
jgi:hypothetical protein